MKNLKINTCLSCPFMMSMHDDFVVGGSQIDTCNLSKKQIRITTSLFGRVTIEGDQIIPDWCELKDGLTIELNK